MGVGNGVENGGAELRQRMGILTTTKAYDISLRKTQQNPTKKLSILRTKPRTKDPSILKPEHIETRSYVYEFNKLR